MTLVVNGVFWLVGTVIFGNRTTSLAGIAREPLDAADAWLAPQAR